MDWSGIDSGPPLRRTGLLSDICLSDVPVISVLICIIFYIIALKSIGPRMAQNSTLTALPMYIYICKSIPLQAWRGPEGSRFQDSRHMEVVRLSPLRTDHLYPPEDIPGTHCC